MEREAAESKRLIDQLDPPRRSGGYWIAFAGIGVAVLMAFVLIPAGHAESVQTTTISTAVLPAKPPPPPKEEHATAPPVAVPETAAPAPPRRSARHLKPVAKPTADEPLPEFPVPASEANH